MAVHRKCLACSGFQDNCVGSDVACDKWARLDFVETEAEAKMPKLIVELPVSVGPVLVESRTQKFLRIGKKRQQQALEAIRKLEHLTSSYYRKREGVTTYTYEWTSEQALDILMPIEVALEKLKRELLTAPAQREHGLVAK